MSNPLAVIVLAAGQGTRMKSNTPKVLHPMCGRPLLGHAIVAAEESGAAKQVVVIRHQRDRVAQMVQDFAPDAVIADQDEIPGTGRAVQCGLEELAKHVDELAGTVFVTSADVPLLTGQTLRELGKAHESAKNAVTVVTTVVEDPTGYGRIIREEGAVTKIVEHRDASEDELAVREINAGIYAFDAAFLAEVLPTLGTDNDQGEVYLTDTIAAAIVRGRRCGAFILEDVWQAQGCNDRVQLSELRAEMNRRILEEHMRGGVTVVDPTSTWIDVDVEIAPDVTIEPGCILEGNTFIDSYSEIGPHTTLRNVEVGEGSIMPYCFAFDALVEAGTLLPAFQQLQNRI